MDVKILGCRMIYTFSERELKAEIIAQGRKGVTIRVTSPKEKGRFSPAFDGCIIVNCLKEQKEKKGD